MNQEFRDLQLELVLDYAESASDFLDEFDQLLLGLEPGQDRPDRAELLSRALAILHTFKGNSGMMGYPEVQRLAHLLEDLFKDEQAGRAPCGEERFEIALSTSATLRRVAAGLSVENPDPPPLGRETALLERILAGESVPAPVEADETMAAEVPGPGAGPACSGAARRSNILKVDFERLDHLLNLVGELVIARTRLAGIETRLREALGERSFSSDFGDALEEVGKITTELHEGIMKVRMLPIRQVFRRFPKSVRDHARARGIEVRLETEGEEVELDKTVIDQIGEPLLHLINNSIDHGIEPPAERVARGKPAVGTILIRAAQRSSHIFIDVEDDGRGIDVDKLRSRAAAAGVLAREMTDDQAIDLIFHPGLSTADAVTSTSGRGVGMDVVRQSVARLNGSIDVLSRPGLGTAFTIKLPLTLAIISALMVESGGERYALPLGAVTETMKLSPGDVHHLDHHPVISYRGRTLPLVYLARALGRDDDPRVLRRRYVIVTQNSSQRVGVVVDDLLGRQEIVIKALDDLAAGADGIAGASILGDGRVVLIIDVPSLWERACRGPVPAHAQLSEAVNE